MPDPHFITEWLVRWEYPSSYEQKWDKDRAKTSKDWHWSLGEHRFAHAFQAMGLFTKLINGEDIPRYPTDPEAPPPRAVTLWKTSGSWQQVAP